MIHGRTGRVAWRLGALALAAALLPLETRAQEEGMPIPPELLAKLAQGKAGEDADDDESRFPKFQDVIKGMDKEEGLFVLYRNDPDDDAKDPEKLLCQIPSRLLDTDLLFATSISRGGFFTGWMWTDYLVRWQVRDTNLVLVLPETRYKQPDDAPVTDAVRRTYTDRYLTTVPILTLSPGGDPVFDLGDLLKSDLADVSWMGMFSGIGTGIRADLSRWTKVKSFPENILVDVDLALAGGQGGGSLGVSYAFRTLPSPGSYSPRAADDRIGYFLTAHQDWTKSSEARDMFERFIQRWKLEKRDPSLELSPPKKPITFIIEKTVPIRWRRWVRQGIEAWNPAFEKIGFVDAIVVQQQTRDNEYKDYDPEDARYNFFRWIVSGAAFAMGPSRVDPRTGQILDADIILDDSMVRFFTDEFDTLGPAAYGTHKPGLERWLKQLPEDFDRRRLPARLRALSESPERAARRVAAEKLARNGHMVCTFAEGMRQQAALLHFAHIATATGKKIPERLLGEVLREVVSHEVGHTLGLRHNFKASSWLGLDELKKRRDTTDEPLCGSVMDYNPVLLFKGDELKTLRHIVTPDIGPYDHWAIEYGYGLPGEGKSEDEMLAEVASRCAQPGLDYATDEDTVWVLSPDPFVNRFDATRDQVAWARTRVELCDALLANVQDWAIKKGEAHYPLRSAVNVLMFEKSNNFATVARLVGGQRFHRDHRGDPDGRAPLVPLDAKTQREALAFLGEQLFAEDFFQFDPALLNQLVPHRWSHWESSPSMRVDYPIHDMVALFQGWTLFDLMFPSIAQRLYDAELKTTEAKPFTAAELITTLRDQVWRQLQTAPPGDGKPYIGSIARGLQREYLDGALFWVQMGAGWDLFSLPPDVHAMQRHALRELSESIGAALAKGVRDFASRAHLTESKSRIDRVLEARFEAY